MVIYHQKIFIVGIGSFLKADAEILEKSKKEAKKRGPYKKRVKKTAKELFLEQFVEIADQENKEFKWVMHCKTLDALLCYICVEAQERDHNVWGDRNKGFGTFNKKSLERHATSQAHKKATAFLEKTKPSFTINEVFGSHNSEPSQLPFHQESDVLIRKYEIPIEYQNLFLNIYWGIKEEIPLTKIQSLNYHTKDTLGVTLPNSHLSFKGMTPIISSIASCISMELGRSISQNQNIGILIDESSDVSGKEILLLYIRFYCKSQNKVVESFATLFELEKMTAEAIYNKLKKWLVENKLFNKVTFYCSDAASNVSSEKNGIPGLMKKDLPLLKSHKCLCHLQNTALRHTYKKFKRLGTFNKDLVEFINYIQNSPKKIRILNEKQIELEFEDVYGLIKAKEIRWNTFFYATERVRSLYPTLHESSLEFIQMAILKDDERNAMNFRNNYILNFEFLYILHWLSDFLQPICLLNKQLQEKTYQLARLKDDISIVVEILDSDYINVVKPPLNNLDNMDHERTFEEIMKHHLTFGGFHLTNFLSQCKFTDCKNVEYQYIDEKKTTLSYSKLPAFELKLLIQSAAKFLKTELLDLIPGDENFFANFSIFDFEKFKTLSKQELNDFGNQEVLKLSNYYLSNDPSYSLQKDLVIIEWRRLKLRFAQGIHNKLFNKEESFNKQSIEYILSNPYFDSGFETMKKLVSIYAVLPCSNAEVERGFSCMNRIKTKIRNRLLPDTLRELMLIDLVGGQPGLWAQQKIASWFSYWENTYHPRQV